MEAISSTVVFLSFVALVVGIINPATVIKWGPEEAKTRQKVVQVYGILLAIAFAIFVITTDQTKTLLFISH